MTREVRVRYAGTELKPDFPSGARRSSLVWILVATLVGALACTLLSAILYSHWWELTLYFWYAIPSNTFIHLPPMSRPPFMPEPSTPPGWWRQWEALPQCLPPPLTTLPSRRFLSFDGSLPSSRPGFIGWRSVGLAGSLGPPLCSLLSRRFPSIPFESWPLPRITPSGSTLRPTLPGEYSYIICWPLGVGGYRFLRPI